MNNNAALRPEHVSNAVNFLVTVGVHDGTPEEVTMEQKVKFLKEKGLTDAEIREAQRMVSGDLFFGMCDIFLLVCMS